MASQETPYFEALPVEPLEPLKKTPLSQRRERGQLALPKLSLHNQVSPRSEAANGTEFSCNVEDSWPSAFVEDFELGAALGSGTVATVRLATRRADGRLVAVKCVKTRDEEMHQFTRDEFELVRQLSHPAIIRFDAIFEISSMLLICMDYCNDGSIESYVAHHRELPEQGSSLLEVCWPEAEGTVQSLAGQLLRGVNHLHHKRVVHRDIKPDNLLLSRHATVLKITDFNSAKRIGKGDLMLSDRGTRLYSAPELRFGLLWNERVDIWSCGLCLYFMIRAGLPFDIQDEKVRRILCEGMLPSLDWCGLNNSPQSRLVRPSRILLQLQGLTKLCLTVNMHDRPIAMELLLHPVFRIGSATSTSRDRSRAETEASIHTELSRDRSRTDAQSPTRKQHRAELFVFVRRCGLVALGSGASKPYLGTPSTSSFGGSPDDALSRHSGMSCYLFGPSAGSPYHANAEEDETPTRMLRSREQDDNTYASFKARTRFDALLRLADHKCIMHSEGSS